MRICSFLPAATEILFALGLDREVVAVSHECDYPSSARTRPKVTTSLIDSPSMSSAQIDALVSGAFEEGRPTYRVEMDVLRAVEPDLIITQDLCVVCAIGGSQVRRAASQLARPPRVLSLQPGSVADVLACIESVGDEAGVSEEAGALVARLTHRLDRIRTAVAGAARPRVLCLEWLEPAWIAGHWMPEVVDLAGGIDILATRGEPSRRASWDAIAEAAPDVALVMPCGFDIDRTLADLHVLETIPQVRQIRAFRGANAFLVDGSSYFNRPGPRIVDGVEILAALLHPDRVSTEIPTTAARSMPSLVFAPAG